MAKLNNVLLEQSVYNQLQLLYPNVPDYDTSVKSMIESSTPVLPTEEQYYDNETPIHIFKSFDFKNMPVDPSQIKSSMQYVPPVPTPSAPAAASAETQQSE